MYCRCLGMGRKKKFCIWVCVIPVTLCCGYLFCVYSIYSRSIIPTDEPDNNFLYQFPDSDSSIRSYKRFQINSANWLSSLTVGEKLTKISEDSESKNKTHNAFINQSKKKYSMFRKPKGFSTKEAGEYLGGSKTDVDRTEERKKKKMLNKLKKGLQDRCQLKDKSACKELIFLERKMETGKINSDMESMSLFENETDPQLEWSSYADKGFTIVGKESSLQRRLPQVLIIGAKKAGTRALLEFLRLHPQVTAAGAELHFFDRYFYKGPAWYRSKLPPSLEGQITIEKTPAYFVDRDAPKRVKNFLPSVRLLLVVRDPVIRAVSDFAQSLSKHDSQRQFRDLVLKNVSSGLVNVAWGPIRGGLYARHFQKWTKYFPRSSIHVISGEGLVSDPAEEMTTVQDFLGLERIINDRHFFFNVTKGFPCLVKREKDGRPHCLGFSKGRTHPNVDIETLKIIRDFYRPFNAKFYKLVGRNFGWP